MEIGMAAKEYLIEIEVRKYTPKMIRSYRNNREYEKISVNKILL